jgi:hypothetical protein
MQGEPMDEADLKEDSDSDEASSGDELVPDSEDDQPEIDYDFAKGSSGTSLCGSKLDHIDELLLVRDSLVKLEQENPEWLNQLFGGVDKAEKMWEILKNAENLINKEKSMINKTN